VGEALSDAGGYDPLGPYRWWHTWTGVSGLHYAWRLCSSPPVVLKAPNQDLLLMMVEQWITTHDDWPETPWPPAYKLGKPLVKPGLATNG
jgi:hypothetical protein